MGDEMIVLIKDRGRPIGRMGAIVDDFYEDGEKVGWRVRILGTDELVDAYGSEVSHVRGLNIGHRKGHVNERR
jgi:hypothetical protein